MSNILNKNFYEILSTIQNSKQEELKQVLRQKLNEFYAQFEGADNV